MSQDEKLRLLLKQDRRYNLESYRFVNDALCYALKQNEKEAEVLANDVIPRNGNHITGQELCYAARDYALRQYGMLARIVLYELGIKKTDDIGNIVFNLLKIGEMSTTEDDKLEDFENVFDLGGELEEGFRFLK